MRRLRGIVSCSPAGALLLVASLFAAGCTETFVAEQNDARDFIDEQLPVGTRRSDAVTLLRTMEFQFRMFTPDQCRHFDIDQRRFQCRGGSGIFVTLEPELWSWNNPFHRPEQLRSFLAFDADERLVESTIFIQPDD